MVRTFCLLLTLLLCHSGLAAEPFDHHRWDKLLKQYVVTFLQGQSSAVDYQTWVQNQTELSMYLTALEKVNQETFNQWNANDQLAFLINAYNAWTIQLVLSAYPKLDSIKDLGSLFRSPWRKRFVSLLGGTYSLDEIEHEWIRSPDRYRDPRIHFAVNCASVGCPALRGEAYIGNKLEDQLQSQTHLFLSDRKRNYVANHTLYLSPIFKWYREDFEKGWLGYHSLNNFLGDYSESLGLTASQRETLKADRMKIRFSDYDWRLNDYLVTD